MDTALSISSNASAAYGFGAGARATEPAAGPAWNTLTAQLDALRANRNIDPLTNNQVRALFSPGRTPQTPGVRADINPAGLSISVAGIHAAPSNNDPTNPQITPEQARKTAEEFVSLSLVQPVLAQLRKTNEAWGVFKPGAHEKQFGPLMDAEIAMRMTRASNFPLVDAVARNLLEFAQRSVKAEPMP